MPTLSQLLKNPRQRPKNRTKTPALQSCPQKKGTCFKVFTRTPKKPNSGVRKVARIRLTNRKRITGYIPGIGHSLMEHSIVLVRGGRVKDLPGVKYHLIRGKYDFDNKTLLFRIHARSKYGVKKRRI
jgi:small subunit ribosomal protein S12